MTNARTHTGAHARRYRQKTIHVGDIVQGAHWQGPFAYLSKVAWIRSMTSERPRPATATSYATGGAVENACVSGGGYKAASVGGVRPADTTAHGKPTAAQPAGIMATDNSAARDAVGDGRTVLALRLGGRAARHRPGRRHGPCGGDQARGHGRARARGACDDTMGACVSTIGPQRTPTMRSQQRKGWVTHLHAHALRRAPPKLTERCTLASQGSKIDGRPNRWRVRRWHGVDDAGKGVQ